MTGIARLPEVERLAALRDAAQEDDPVMFVYGPGTDDAFVDTAYRIYGLEEALWESLHAAGFDRIGFYSLTRKLYFRDEESLRAVRPGLPGQASRPARRRMRAGFIGPLGNRIVGGVGPGAGSSAADAGSAADPGLLCPRRPRRLGARAPRASHAAWVIPSACRCSTT